MTQAFPLQWPHGRPRCRAAGTGRGMTAPVCRKCGADMKPGKALAQTFTGGTPDLCGDVMTFSAGGPGKLIDCWKCPACGWSVSK